MQHPKSWHDFRRKGWGGSDATTLMTGTDDERLKLNHVKRGLCEGDDLSNVLPVQMGNATEDLNITWFENQSGLIVTGRSGQYIHPDKDYMRANVDGKISGAVLECKYHGGNSTIVELAEKYFWQMQHYMYVAYFETCYLSVIFGHYSRHEYMAVPRDKDAINKWLTVADAEWQNVLDNKDPVSHIPEKVTISLDNMREIDVAGQNFEGEWETAATVWAHTKQHAADFKVADKSIKTLIPDDVKKIWGHGITVSRSKNGALRIKESK